MESNIYAVYALDLARQRSLEAERRARLLDGAKPPRTLPRAVLGRLAASLHQLSAALKGRVEGRAAVGSTSR